MPITLCNVWRNIQYIHRLQETNKYTREIRTKSLVRGTTRPNVTDRRRIDYESNAIVDTVTVSPRMILFRAIPACVCAWKNDINVFIRRRRFRPSIDRITHPCRWKLFYLSLHAVCTRHAAPPGGVDRNLIA